MSTVRLRRWGWHDLVAGRRISLELLEEPVQISTIKDEAGTRPAPSR
jgi:hypothetical protein